MKQASNRRLRLGIALADDHLHATVLGRGGGSWSCALAPRDGEWIALREALAELPEALGAEVGRIDFALLPPLVEVRWVELPPLREEELHAVLARDVRRYFPGVREPQVVAAVRARTGAPVLAAIAPASLLHALERAAAEGEWTMGAVTPAYAAWTAASTVLWPELRRGRGALVVAGERRTEVLQVEHGTISFVRRLPAAECQAEALVGALGDGSARVAVIGPPGASAPLVEFFAAHRVTSLQPSRGEYPVDSPGALAAAFAADGPGPVFLSEGAREGVRRRTRRAVGALATLAAALLLTAGLLELWGAQRELDAVLARREAIRTAVGEVAAVREIMDGLEGRASVLAELEAMSPRWSGVVARVGGALPKDAHLSALRARGDTLALEGVARRAGGVFDGVRRIPGVTEVRADAPIRREMREGRFAGERFVLSARIRSTGGEEP